MTHNIKTLKSRIAAGAAAAGMLISCNAAKLQFTDTIDTSRPGISEYFDSTVFSLENLSDMPSEYSSKALISKDKAEYFKNEVWKIWQEANILPDGKGLPETRPLSEGISSVWNLPQELEPDASMPFYWGCKGEKPADGYPLYIYLHGSGPKDAEWATGLKLCNAFKDSASIYFIPQIPNEGEYYRWWHQSKQYAIERLIRLALASGEVNPDKIYIFGISEGGYGSQRLASFYADYLAAAGPMAGGEPLINAPAENCGNIGFSLRTGAEDKGFYRDILTGYTKEKFDLLESEYPGEYRHNIELIPGMGHGIDYFPTVPWMEQFTRDAFPKHFIWENYEMHGRYRDCFYNIAVNDSTHSGRVEYEVSIEGNEIEIVVSDVKYECTQTDPYWGIQMKFDRTKTPAEQGDMTIYLNDSIVNLDQKVTVTVNGKEVFNGMVDRDLASIVNSCATFHDPERLFTASIKVNFQEAEK